MCEDTNKSQKWSLTCQTSSIIQNFEKSLWNIKFENWIAKIKETFLRDFGLARFGVCGIDDGVLGESNKRISFGECEWTT